MVRERFETCQCYNKHHSNPSNPFLPTSLIDVGDDDNNTHPRLILTADAEISRDTARYAALSYCWGPEPEAQFKTTKSTLSQRLEAFALDNVTPVVRDAVLVTRRLNIRYLWIDSLCIVQDDQSDWASESSTMAQVFQQAYITVCTTVSPSCSVGFRERSPNTAVIHFKSKMSSSIQGTYNIRPGGVNSI